MSTRHSKMGGIIKEATEVNDLYYSDQQTLEDVLDHFGNQFTKKETIKALRKNDGDYDSTIDYLEEELDKRRNKQQKKETKKKIVEEIKAAKEKEELEKVPEPEPKREISRKISDGGDSSHRPVRKSSSTDYQISIRKLSSQVEDVDIEHYNTDYPKVNDAHALSNSLSVVVIGHVDSGKSTLTGQILQQLNTISKTQIHKNQKESKQIGRQSFKFAWVMDENEDERNKGVTIDVGMRDVGYNGKRIVFLDSPGHKQYIPNMINGAVQADYAILVIDGSKFDSGFNFGGQTKQHAYIVKALGVSTMIIALNKMDLLEWSEEEFIRIRNLTLEYLLEIGFQEDKLVYVPISAFHNINIVTPKQLSYYQGPPLLQLIGNLDLPPRPVDKPFRLNIANVYESATGKLKGNCISGKIEGGVLKQNDKLVILPVNSQVIVKEIILGGEKVKSATVGDNIECQIRIIDETFFENIKCGNVMSSLNFSIPVTRRVIAEILTFQLEMPILCGTPVVAYLGCGKHQGKIQKILKIFDSKNRGITKKQNAKAVTSNQCCQVQISFNQRVCVQLFSNFKRFGRVILREKHSTLAVGIIKEVLPLRKDEK